VADRVGISAVYVAGGMLLALAGILGLALLGNIHLNRPTMDQRMQAHREQAR
jgi:hypothetical protein